jgi:hypothetical protein
MSVPKISVLLPIAAALLAACERSSESAGIDGTGAPLMVAENTLAYGAVTELGSVVVNEARYDTSKAAIVIDGQAGTEADIEPGDVVLVVAEPDPANPLRLMATSVTVDDAVEGPISAIDAATGSLVALGQTVRVVPATVFDDNVATGSPAGLAVGDIVEIAGFRAANADIVATRIELKPVGGGFETTGAATNVDVVARRFTVGGLTVDYGTVAPSPSFRDADLVEVKGFVSLASGELVATSVARVSTLSGAAGDRVDLEGYVTAVDTSSPRSFDVAGAAARTTNDTILTDVAVALDEKVNVQGSLDSAGTVVATEVGRATFGSATPPSGVYTVVGRVFDWSTGVAGRAPVNLWVESSTLNYSYWWANGALYTNGSGEFTAVNLPASQISIHAGHQGWVQPCAVSSRVPQAEYLQVEVQRGSAFATANPPRPQLVQGAAMTGTVFETVNGARQAVPGALIWAYSSVDIDLASTMTDLQGRFFLCNLPPQVALFTSKDGYRLNEAWPVAGNASAVEIEMIRQ